MNHASIGVSDKNKGVVVVHLSAADLRRQKHQSEEGVNPVYSVDVSVRVRVSHKLDFFITFYKILLMGDYIYHEF